MSFLNKFHKVKVMNDEIIVININSVVGFRTICTDPVGAGKGENYVVEALFILQRIRVRGWPSSDDNSPFECIIMKRGTQRECEIFLDKLVKRIRYKDMIIWITTLTMPVLLSLVILNAKSIWNYMKSLSDLLNLF